MAVSPQYPTCSECVNDARPGVGPPLRPAPILRQVDLQELQQIAARRYDEFVEHLRAMVNVDCGSFSPEGVNQMADWCQASFEAGGWTADQSPHAPARGEPPLSGPLIALAAGPV